MEPVNILGKGAMACVYNFQHKKYGEVACKQYHFTPTFDYKSYFRKEIENLRKLNHENIIKILGVEFNTSSLYLELMDINLFKFIKLNNDINKQAQYSIIQQICCGLSYIHNNKMIHRDLKTSNILISSLHRIHTVKICDFDSCIEYNGSNSALTQTRGYRCPEQLLNIVYNESADLFSLGCIIFEILVGTQLFNDDLAYRDCDSDSDSDCDCDCDCDDLYNFTKIRYYGKSFKINERDELLNKLRSVIGMIPCKYYESSPIITNMEQINSFPYYKITSIKKIANPVIINEELIDIIESCLSYDMIKRPSAQYIIDKLQHIDVDEKVDEKVDEQYDIETNPTNRNKRRKVA